MSSFIDIYFVDIDILQTKHQQSALNVSSSQDQKCWTLYKMYWRLANGILMGTLRSKSHGVYGGGEPNEWFI